jgi:hypothetical protein
VGIKGERSTSSAMPGLWMVFSSWYILNKEGRLGKVPARCRESLQLLQIAVRNIMAAPVRNSIELDAV